MATNLGLACHHDWKGREKNPLNQQISWHSQHFRLAFPAQLSALSLTVVMLKLGWQVPISRIIKILIWLVAHSPGRIRHSGCQVRGGGDAINFPLSYHGHDGIVTPPPPPPASRQLIHEGRWHTGVSSVDAVKSLLGKPPSRLLIQEQDAARPEQFGFWDRIFRPCFKNIDAM